MTASKKNPLHEQIIQVEHFRKIFGEYLNEAGDELAGAGGAPVGAAPAAPPAAAPAAAVPTPDQNMGNPLDPNAAPGAAGQPVQYTVEQFVDSMNKIRGGRSFDDQEVYQQITTMFNGLDDPSKETLRNVITQVQAIVQPAPQQNAAPGQESLPSETNTQSFQNNVNAPPAAPPAIPAMAEAPPA